MCGIAFLHGAHHVAKTSITYSGYSFLNGLGSCRYLSIFGIGNGLRVILLIIFLKTRNRMTMSKMVQYTLEILDFYIFGVKLFSLIYYN